MKILALDLGKFKTVVDAPEYHELTNGYGGNRKNLKNGSDTG